MSEREPLFGPITIGAEAIAALASMCGDTLVPVDPPHLIEAYDLATGSTAVLDRRHLLACSG